MIAVRVTCVPISSRIVSLFRRNLRCDIRVEDRQQLMKNKTSFGNLTCFLTNGMLAAQILLVSRDLANSLNCTGFQMCLHFSGLLQS